MDKVVPPDSVDVSPSAQDILHREFAQLLVRRRSLRAEAVRQRVREILRPTKVEHEH